MNFEKLLLLIMCVIILFIGYEVIRLQTMKKCPKPYIEYRYVPRSFKDEQEEPVPLEDIFNSMFSKSSPWMMSRGIGLKDRRETGLKGRKMKV
jgi:hypothetical protein